MTAIATQPSLTLSPSAGEKRDFARELRQQTVACRVRHEKLGVRMAVVGGEATP